MKTYKGNWKVTPEFELKEGEDLEEKEHDLLMEITMNPHDYIEFEEVEESDYFLCVSCQNSFKADDLNSSGLCEGCQLQDRE